MKRVKKSAEEKFESLKEQADGFEVFGGMVKYDVRNNLTTIYLDDNQEVRTYQKLPDDVDFQTLAEGISYNSSGNISLDDFINFYSEPDGVSDIDVHEAWVDYLKDENNYMDFESEFIGPEYEEVQEQKVFDDFARKIQGKTLQQIEEDCDIQMLDEDEGCVWYQVLAYGDFTGYRFEIKVFSDSGEIWLIPEIEVENIEHLYDHYAVELQKEVLTYSGKQVDASILALTSEQKIALELVRMAFKLASETNLGIFTSAEVGTFAYNGNKLREDGVLCQSDPEESEKINFTFRKGSPLETVIPGLTDAGVYHLCSGYDYGLSVSKD